MTEQVEVKKPARKARTKAQATNGEAMEHPQYMQVFTRLLHADGLQPDANGLMALRGRVRVAHARTVAVLAELDLIRMTLIDQ